MSFAIASQKIYIGTAGWSIPAHARSKFPPLGPLLKRYSQVFNAVEINSAFYRDHLPETYAKWASMVPEDFRFSVKLSRYFTQMTRLHDTGRRLAEVLHGIAQLGSKWGVLLVQLPPSLSFESATARKFFSALRKHYKGPLALEPRHMSWTTPAGLQLLSHYHIGKVLADPEPCPLPEGRSMTGVDNLLYCRLHGSPEIYKSNYEPEAIEGVSELLQTAARRSIPAWCIFDNTTYGYATDNALHLWPLEGRQWQSSASP